MQPLDLRLCCPRPPRERLAGIVFTPRVIDKIRASLPGGELNGYFTDIGMSIVWAHYTRVDLDELRTVVKDSETEEDVERWIEARTSHLDKERINKKLESIDSSRMPESWREAFENAYPADLRERYTYIMDLIEADDARR